MKILAWILLVMGVLLILAAIIIFLKFGGREACENLRKTKDHMQSMKRIRLCLIMIRSLSKRGV